MWMLLLGIGLFGVALVIPSAKQAVTQADTVTVNYALKLEDGTVYYSSIGHEPLNAALGQGKLLPAFEEELIGMHVGETKTFTLPPEKAYGNYRPEMVGTFDRSRLPEGVEPEIGKQIQANLKDGTQTIAVIVSFTDTTVTLDANHPLAGETLIFDVDLLAIGEDSVTGKANSLMVTRRWLPEVGLLALVFVFFRRLSRKAPFVTWRA